MKKLFSLLTLALLTTSVWAANTYVKVTSADQLEAGKKYILVNEEAKKALGAIVTYGSNNVGDTVNISITNSITDIEGTNAVELTLGGSTDAWTFDMGGEGKYLSWSSGNTLTTAANTESNNAKWIATSTNDGFVLNNKADNNRKLQYNSGNPRFACYTSSQKPAVLYIQDAGAVVPVTVAAPEFHPNGGKFTVNSLPVTITCADGPCDIYYSEGTELDWTNYTYYSGEFYVTETKTFTAVAYKEGVESDPTTVTFTKVDPAPAYTFLPIVYDAVNNDAFTVEKDGVTFTCTKGAITDNDFRIYKNQTATFTAGEGVADIVKIEFFCTAEGTDQYGPGCFTLNSKDGSYSYEDSIGTWTGKARSVSLTASTNQVRATKIVFTLDDGTTAYVQAPTLPASCEFENEMTVTITNNEEGATVKYSLNDGAYTEYETPFTINETTTVKAYAEYNGIQSNTVSATYTKVEVPDITTLAQVNALGNGKEFEFKGDAVVTAQMNNYLWLRDNSGYGLIYGYIKNESNDTLSFTPGTILNKNWTAKTKIYNGLMEYENAANVSASGNTNAELAAIQEITALDAEMINAYVTVKNITKFTKGNGKNYTATLSDGTTMAMYNTFNLNDIPTTEGNYFVTGAVGIFNTTLQLTIISWEGQGTPEPDPVAVNNFGEAYAQESGTKITMYNDVVVTYQNGNRLWIRDTQDASGMIYGALKDDAGQALTFANGDVLSDGWTATYELFNELTPEFTNPKDISDSGDDREAAPFERTTITTANVNEYVILKGVTLVPDTADTDIYYTADNLQICNFFNGVEIPTVEEGKTYDVTGIVLISQAGLVRVYITEMTEATAAGLRGDVDNSGIVDISDATALINYLLYDNSEGLNMDNANCDLTGGIDISDATTLINYLLYGTW